MKETYTIVIVLKDAELVDKVINRGVIKNNSGGVISFYNYDNITTINIPMENILYYTVRINAEAD